MKVIAFSTAGLILAFGLCGLDAHLYPHSEFGGSSLAGLGALLFVGAGLGLIVGCLWAIGKFIAGMFSKATPKDQ